MRARIDFGNAPGEDVLRLVAKIGASTAEWDPDNQDLTVAVTDDDDIYRVTIPAGSFQRKGSVFKYKDPSGSLNGIKRATVRTKGNGEVMLSLKTIPMDLANADRTQHMVHLQIDIGSYSATHHRLWEARGDRFIAIKH